MVTITDGLGRPLYSLDSRNKRLHPDTMEEMPDDWQKEWPNCNISVWPYVGMALAILLALVILFSSCRVQKNIQTSQVNTDSVVNAEKKKLTEVHEREVSELKRQISELTSSGVTFVVDSCPEREAILLLLDSAGRANYEKAMLELKLKSLNNKVTISERGAITAEGQIRAAFFTNSKLQEELYTSERSRDSLLVELDSSRVQYSRLEQVKNKEVKRTVFPWWFWLTLAVAPVLTWVVRGRLNRI